MADNFDDSEIFFYAAVCCLKGKKAFLTPRPDVDKAIEYIEAAKMIEPRPLHDYFLAYIKQDYFNRKGYRISPDFEQELGSAHAKGLAEGDVEYLYEVLAVQRPSELKWFSYLT